MYYKFNETNNMTGFIKEFLHNFNLPTCKVYREDRKLNKGRVYVKGNYLYRYNGSDLDNLGYFISSKVMLNSTSKLQINSSIYDSYTHEYLGNYLRFLRDYDKLDLMSLYNCFSDRRPVDINLTLLTKTGNYFRINTEDKRYNYYIVPIKFDEEYTIAIDSPTPYEICGLLYLGDEVTEMSTKLIKETYKVINGSTFSSPYVYKLDVDSDNYWEWEKYLKLLIKLPKVVDSSIVVLEGNYLTDSSVIGGVLTPKKYYFQPAAKEEEINPATKLSLLRINDKVSYPFADRLVEYLLGNVITKLDKIEGNINRVQDIVYDDSIFMGFYGIWDKNLKLKLHDLIMEVSDRRKNPALLYLNDGSPEKKYYFDDDSSEGIRKNSLRFIDTKEDLLTNVDKDVEELLVIRYAVDK